MDSLYFTIDKMTRSDAEKFIEDYGCEIQPRPFFPLMKKDDIVTFDYGIEMPVEIVNGIRHNLSVLTNAIEDGYSVNFDRIQLRRFQALLQEVVDSLDTIDNIS